MKKLVLVLAIVFAGVMSVNAQVWIGGRAGFGIQDDQTRFSIAPELGYNINNNWTVAAGLNYMYDKQDMGGVLGVVTVNRFIASPYVRYVGGTIGKKFSLFLDLVYDIDLLSTQMWEAGLKPGIAWQATDKFTAAFRFGFLGYDHYFERGKGIFMDGSLETGSIGIYYNF